MYKKYLFEGTFSESNKMKDKTHTIEQCQYFDMHIYIYRYTCTSVFYWHGETTKTV